MESKPRAFAKVERSSLNSGKTLDGYGLGSARFAGAPDALYERRMQFDNLVEPESPMRASATRRPRVR